MNRAAAILLICVSALFAMGLLMVFGTSSAELLGRSSSMRAHVPLLKQLIFASVSFGLVYLIVTHSYTTILNHAPTLYWLLIIMLALCFVPGIGQQINGSNRWIGWGFASLQPSEFMKPVAVLYTVHFLQNQKSVTFKSFLHLFSLLAIPLVLIIMEPDNGTIAILLATFVVLFFIERIKWYYWGAPLLVFISAGVLAASKMPHVQDRINVYLHPEIDILGKGHQPYQAKIAAGSGSVFGRGVGESLQKLNYLPEARCDYIAAIYAEEFGFIGMLVLILLYMTIALVGFWIASRSKTREGYILSGALTFMLTFQAFLNLGVVSGLLPSKGTNLPFFSQGGSSLMMNSIVIALILSVARKEQACTSS